MTTLILRSHLTAKLSGDISTREWRVQGTEGEYRGLESTGDWRVQGTGEYIHGTGEYREVKESTGESKVLV